MSNVSAHLLVGTPGDSGSHLHPTHLILFDETAPAHWTLFSLESTEPSENLILAQWNCGENSQLEDGLLLAGLFAASDSELRQWAAREGGELDGGQADWITRLDGHKLDFLRQLAQKAGGGLRGHLTVLEGSALIRQLSQLAKYELQVEVHVSRALHQTLTRI